MVLRTAGGALGERAGRAPITELSPDEVYRSVEAVWPAAPADAAHSIGSR
jgi:hypothetical protein